MLIAKSTTIENPGSPHSNGIIRASIPMFRSICNDNLRMLTGSRIGKLDIRGLLELERNRLIGVLVRGIVGRGRVVVGRLGRTRIGILLLGTILGLLGLARTLLHAQLGGLGWGQWISRGTSLASLSGLRGGLGGLGRTVTVLLRLAAQKVHVAADGIGGKFCRNRQIIALRLDIRCCAR